MLLEGFDVALRRARVRRGKLLKKYEYRDQLGHSRFSDLFAKVMRYPGVASTSQIWNEGSPIRHWIG